MFSSAELNAACLKTQPGSYACRAFRRYLTDAGSTPSNGGAGRGDERSPGSPEGRWQPRARPARPEPPALQRGWRRLRRSELCVVTHFPAVFLHSDRGPSRTSITLRLTGFSISYCSRCRNAFHIPTHAHGTVLHTRARKTHRPQEGEELEQQGSLPICRKFS